MARSEPLPLWNEGRKARTDMLCAVTIRPMKRRIEYLRIAQLVDQKHLSLPSPTCLALPRFSVYKTPTEDAPATNVI